MKLWLDDIRPAPKNWVLVKCPEDAITALRTGFVDIISLDHDLGNDVKGTGYDVLLWLEKQLVFNPEMKIPKIKIHTANISARKKMELAVESIKRRINEK